MKIINNWYENLINKIFEEIPEQKPEEITSNNIKGLVVALTDLGKDEDMIILKYRFGMNDAELTQYYNLYKNQISATIERAIKKLRQPKHIDLIKMGVDLNLQELSKTSMEDVPIEIDHMKISKDVLDIPLSSMNLSLRTFNILYKNNIKTIRDVVNLDLAKIHSLYSFGMKSAHEVATKLKEYGITQTIWDHFLVENPSKTILQKPSKWERSDSVIYL